MAVRKLLPHKLQPSIGEIITMSRKVLMVKLDLREIKEINFLPDCAQVTLLAKVLITQQKNVL